MYSLYRPSVPRALLCDIASQYEHFCSVNSGVLLRVRNRVRVWVWLGLGIGIAFHFSNIIHVLGLGLALVLKFLIILAVTLPSRE